MCAYVYILGDDSLNQRTYVGWTLDLDRRLGQHNGGAGAKTTRGRSWALLYAERYDTREEAMSREYFLKRDRKLRALIRIA